MRVVAGLLGSLLLLLRSRCETNRDNHAVNLSKNGGFLLRQCNTAFNSRKVSLRHARPGNDVKWHRWRDDVTCVLFGTAGLGTDL